MEQHLGRRTHGDQIAELAGLAALLSLGLAGLRTSLLKALVIQASESTRWIAR